MQIFPATATEAPARPAPALGRGLTLFVRLTIFALLVIAAASFLLALFILAGGLALWFGVGMRTGLWLAAKLGGMAVVAFVAARLVRLGARRLAARTPPPPRP